jgi:hypothetical protein
VQAWGKKEKIPLSSRLQTVEVIHFLATAKKRHYKLAMSDALMASFKTFFLINGGSHMSNRPKDMPEIII